MVSFEIGGFFRNQGIEGKCMVGQSMDDTCWRKDVSMPYQGSVPSDFTSPFPFLLPEPFPEVLFPLCVWISLTLYHFYHNNGSSPKIQKHQIPLSRNEAGSSLDVSKIKDPLEFHKAL
jgi:hypothetical protein